MPDISTNENLLKLKGKSFYDFLESTFSFDLTEIIRRQGYSSPYSLLHSKKQLLDFIHIKSDDPGLIAIKRLAAFRRMDDTWIIKLVSNTMLMNLCQCFINSENRNEGHTLMDL